MGFLTAVATFPLAPLRGVLWLTDRVAEASLEEAFGEDSVRRELDELERRLREGEISAEEHAEVEEALLERLLAGRADFEGDEEDWYG